VEDKYLMSTDYLSEQQPLLNQYFGNHWTGSLEKYEHSGWALLLKIPANARILDVGCGLNLFAPYFPNLIGIDPASLRAHQQVTIEEFKTSHIFDVALCLGSINFGSEANIIRQITKVTTLLAPAAKIFWRCNPGVADHADQLCRKIHFYEWTIEKHYELANRFGFSVVEARWEPGINRIYAEWARA
jgi:hypothetical protein